MVPVTPTRVSFRLGLPYHCEARQPRAWAESATRIKQTFRGISPGNSSQTMAEAPAATAAGMKRCPSTLTPRTATNIVPGAASRESAVSRLISVFCGPAISTGVIALSRACRFCDASVILLVMNMFLSARSFLAESKRYFGAFRGGRAGCRSL